MSPSLTDYEVVWGRRSSPVRSNGMLSPSYFPRSSRSHSSSRLDEPLAFNRGRSLLTPEVPRHIRSRSWNGAYDDRSSAYAYDVGYEKDYPEPERLVPSSKLTRGGVPLYKSSGLDPDYALSINGASRPKSPMMRARDTRSSRRSTSLSRASKTLSSYSTDEESDSPLYEKKRHLAPPRSISRSLSPSRHGKRQSYIGRQNNHLDLSSTPPRHRASFSYSQTRTRVTSPATSLNGNGSIMASPHRVYTSPRTTSTATERRRTPSPQSSSSRSSTSPSNRAQVAPRAITDSRGRQPSRSRSTASRSVSNGGSPLQIRTRSSTPAKKVRFADEESDSDTDSDISLASPVFIEKRQLEPKKSSQLVAVKADEASPSYRRPESRGYGARGNLVLARRRVQTGWSKTKVVWSHRSHGQHLRVF